MIELITMAPGSSLFDGFGHAALRVIEQPEREPGKPSGGSDLVYAFGALDYTGPLLGLRFLRGEVLFEARARSWARTVRLYSRQDRTIYRQRLRLTPDEARQVAADLRRSILPEHYRYPYHHFDNNCATRLRDIIDRATRGEVRRNLDVPGDGRGYREHVLEGLSGNPFLLLGMHIIQGRPTERPLTRWEAAFVPAEFRDALATAVRSDGTYLAEPIATVYVRQRPLERWPIAWGSRMAWLLAGLAVVLWLAWRLGCRPGCFVPGVAGGALAARLVGSTLLLWALAAGGIGLFLELVALSARVPEFRHNENLLLFTGLDLLLLLPAFSLLLPGPSRAPHATPGRTGPSRWRARLIRATIVYLALRALVAAAVLLGQALGLLVQHPLSLALLACCWNVVLWDGVRLTASFRSAKP